MLLIEPSALNLVKHVPYVTRLSTYCSAFSCTIKSRWKSWMFLIVLFCLIACHLTFVSMTVFSQFASLWINRFRTHTLQNCLWASRDLLRKTKQSVSMRHFTISRYVCEWRVCNPVICQVIWIYDVYHIWNSNSVSSGKVPFSLSFAFSIQFDWFNRRCSQSKWLVSKHRSRHRQ